MEAVKENVPPIPLSSLKPLGDESSDPLLYQKLYHASVERYAHLQDQLEKYSSLLLSKHQKIAELKDKTLSGLARNKEFLDAYRDRLVQKEGECQRKLEGCLLREETLKKEYAQLRGQYQDKVSECCEWERRCGVLVARGAVSRAETRAKDTVVQNITSRKEFEIERIKKKLTNYSHSLMRKHAEVKESLEFSEAERSALVEANAEAEALANSLRAQLEEKTKLLEQTRAELEERTTELDKARSSKCVHLPPSLTMPDIPPSSCTMCQDLGKQLGVALAALNGRGCTNYGNLLHEKFIVEQKVKALEGKLSAGLQEHHKLMTYTQEYKAKSVEKVSILKENIEKADREIAELDKLVDMVREAMRSSMDLVRQSPTLLKVLLEIEGASEGTSS